MGQKYQTDVISPSRHTQKSSQHVRACATVDGAICSKNRKIVPYHGDSPNSRISARLRSPSPTMAPGPDYQTLMHLSMLSCRGGGGGERPGTGGGFELRSVFLFKCPAPGKSSWVKKVQIPHTRVISVGQKNSTNDQKSLPRADL